MITIYHVRKDKPAIDEPKSEKKVEKKIDGDGGGGGGGGEGSSGSKSKRSRSPEGYDADVEKKIKKKEKKAEEKKTEEKDDDECTSCGSGTNPHPRTSTCPVPPKLWTGDRHQDLVTSAVLHFMKSTITSWDGVTMWSFATIRINSNVFDDAPQDLLVRTAIDRLVHNGFIVSNPGNDRWAWSKTNEAMRVVKRDKEFDCTRCGGDSYSNYPHKTKDCINKAQTVETKTTDSFRRRGSRLTPTSTGDDHQDAINDTVFEFLKATSDSYGESTFGDICKGCGIFEGGFPCVRIALERLVDFGSIHYNSRTDRWMWTKKGKRDSESHCDYARRLVAASGDQWYTDLLKLVTDSMEQEAKAGKTGCFVLTPHIVWTDEGAGDAARALAKRIKNDTKFVDVTPRWTRPVTNGSPLHGFELVWGSNENPGPCYPLSDGEESEGEDSDDDTARWWAHQFGSPYPPKKEDPKKTVKQKKKEATERKAEEKQKKATKKTE